MDAQAAQDGAWLHGDARRLRRWRGGGDRHRARGEGQHLAPVHLCHLVVFARPAHPLAHVHRPHAGGDGARLAGGEGKRRGCQVYCPGDGEFDRVALDAVLARPHAGGAGGQGAQAVRFHRQHGPVLHLPGGITDGALAVGVVAGDGEGDPLTGEDRRRRPREAQGPQTGRLQLQGEGGALQAVLAGADGGGTKGEDAKDAALPGGVQEGRVELPGHRAGEVADTAQAVGALGPQCEGLAHRRLGGPRGVHLDGDEHGRIEGPTGEFGPIQGQAAPTLTNGGQGHRLRPLPVEGEGAARPQAGGVEVRGRGAHGAALAHRLQRRLPLDAGRPGTIQGWLQAVTHHRIGGLDGEGQGPGLTQPLGLEGHLAYRGGLEGAGSLVPTGRPLHRPGGPGTHVVAGLSGGRPQVHDAPLSHPQGRLRRRQSQLHGIGLGHPHPPTQGRIRRLHAHQGLARLQRQQDPAGFHPHRLAGDHGGPGVPFGARTHREGQRPFLDVRRPFALASLTAGDEPHA